MEQRGHADEAVHVGVQVGDGDALLLHGVAVAHGYGVIVERVVVHRDAEWRTNRVLATVAAADGVLLVVLHVVVELKLGEHLAGLLGESVLFDKRQHRGFDGRQGKRDGHNRALAAVFERLLAERAAEHGEEHAVESDGGLEHVRHVALLRLRVEVAQFLVAVLFVLFQVKVRARVDALELFEAHREVEFDVASGIGVVGQFHVVVEPVVLLAEAKGFVPIDSGVFPVVVPRLLRARLDEELHLHLLEFTHAENELARDDLVAEGLANLRNPKRQLHPPALLHVQVVHEDALRRFRTEVNHAGVATDGTELGLEHQVELTHVGPVLRTANGASDAEVFDEGLHSGQVLGVHRGLEAGVDVVDFALAAQDLRVRLAELSLVKGVAEALGGLGDVFFGFSLQSWQCAPRSTRQRGSASCCPCCR